MLELKLNHVSKGAFVMNRIGNIAPANEIFKCSFLSENIWKLIKIPLKCIPECPSHR